MMSVSLIKSSFLAQFTLFITKFNASKHEDVKRLQLTKSGGGLTLHDLRQMTNQFYYNINL